MKETEAKMDAFAALRGSLKNGPAAVLKAYKAFDEKGEKLLSYATRFNQTPTATFQELSTSDI